MPQPQISSHSLPFTCDPAREQSTSKLGSVNGKKCGRKRNLRSSPSSSRKKYFERALEVGKRDAFVDDEAFHLEERHAVRRVDFVTAIAAAGRDDAQRRRLREHGADLHCGGLRAHEAATAQRAGLEAGAGGETVFLEIKCVLLVARGMIGQRVERVEIEDFVLDVGAIGESEAEAAEDFDGAVARLQNGMERAGRLVAAGQRGIEVGGLGRGGEVGLLRVEGGGDLVLGRVGGLADDGLLVAGNLGHALEQLGPASAAREVLDAHFLERVGRRRAGDGAEDFFTEGLDVVEHGESRA